MTRKIAAEMCWWIGAAAGVVAIATMPSWLGLLLGIAVAGICTSMWLTSSA